MNTIKSVSLMTGETVNQINYLVMRGRLPRLTKELGLASYWTEKQLPEVIAAIKKYRKSKEEK